FIVGGPVGDFELLLCHGTVCVVGKMRDLILQLSKSSIYSTKPGSLHAIKTNGEIIRKVLFVTVGAMMVTLSVKYFTGV
ncbi:hypothetical protein C0Q71_26215, partial [Klebsiella pneumoniae]|nr:hypothetical protein [Klebsiella pneumoniae]